MTHQKFWERLLGALIIVILISPLIYWASGIGQSAPTLAAEISRLADGTLASSPKAEALHQLRLPMRIERMIIYPLLLLAFQFSGLALSMRSKIETKVQPCLIHHLGCFRRLPYLPKVLTRIHQKIPHSWQERLNGADLIITVCFILGLNLAIFGLYLPFNFYRGFIVPHQFGLSTLTTLGWFNDWLKNVLITLTIEGALWTGFYLLMHMLPRRWPILGGALLMLASFGLVLLTPILITPLFFTVRPLHDAELRTHILTLTKRAGVPVDEVYVIDASAKTTQVNAYVTGFGGAKRIVLFDTLLKGYTPDEVEVVLAHELGHWYYRHVLFSLLALGAAAWIGLFALRWLLKYSWPKLGLSGPADVAGLPYLMALITLVTLLSLPLQNAFSRYAENQTDAFALSVSQKPTAFATLFEQFAEQNLSIVAPPSWEKFIFSTHPSIAERIRRAEEFGQVRPETQ